MKSILILLALATSSLFAASTPPRPPLLAAGTPAPDFTALRADNTPVKLSEFRGKVVLVDFWAPWCGPCRETMPQMEKLHVRLEKQGLVVLGVCVWDDRTNFDGWLKSPGVRTSYLKVFDPAGRKAGDIARRLYSVAGIPTFYLIDRDGKVAHAGVGSGPQTARALEQALGRLGFKL